MRLKIALNEIYRQQMLDDPEFRIKLTITLAGPNEYWIENDIIDNSEQVFRSQALEMIRVHFCRIFNLPESSTQIANNDKFLPSHLIRLNVIQAERTIASIISFDH